MTSTVETSRPTVTQDVSFDRELTAMTAPDRWREWMGRVESAIFASGSPVSRKELAKLVGQGVSVERLIDDIQAELKPRPYELVAVDGGWILRTRKRFAVAISSAADVGDRTLGFNEIEAAVLCAVAYHQPITRDGLRDIFGKEISRDLIARLRHLKLIANGPRAPRRGAPTSYVTTPEFLVMFDLNSLRDLPDLVVSPED